MCCTFVLFLCYWSLGFFTMQQLLVGSILVNVKFSIAFYGCHLHSSTENQRCSEGCGGTLLMRSTENSYVCLGYCSVMWHVCLFIHLYASLMTTSSKHIRTFSSCKKECSRKGEGYTFITRRLNRHILCVLVNAYYI